MLKLKKIVALVLLSIFCLGVATGCNTGDSNPNPTPPVQERPANNKPTEQEQTNPDKEQEQQKEAGTKQDSGSYQGQIDSNSIEIKISGVPENIAYRAFQLSEAVKEGFDKLDLQPGDQVRFTYTEEEGKQPIISEINKI